MAKRRKKTDAAYSVRDAYAFDNRTCEVCGSNATHTTHELSGGPSRRIEVKQTECMLAVCHECHMKIHLFPSEYSKVTMAAIKLRRTLDKINAARVGRGMIPLDEVIAHLETLP